MRLKFPYTLFRGLPVPIIPLELHGPKGWRSAWAFIDSGATFSIFHSSVAEQVGFDLNQAQTVSAMLGDGDLLQARMIEVPVKVGSNQLILPIGFSSGLKVGFNILGRRGLFEAFTVCFNDRYRHLTLTAIPSLH